MTKNNLDLIQRYFKTNSILAKVKTNNVTNPILWLIGLWVIIFICVVIFNQFIIEIFVIIVLISLTIFFMYIYNYFKKVDPNRLQSDECQIARLQIEMEASKYQGDIKGKQITSDPTQELIDNAHSEEG